MEANTYNIKNDNSKISIIKVVNLRLRAFIGFNDVEKEKMQDLIISFSFKYNTFLAVKFDDSNFAVNYKTITKNIIRLVEHQSFALLETLADKIWATIRKNPYTMNVNVRVEKPHALRFCDNVLVEISDEDRFNEVVIGIGSNIEANEHVAKALKELSSVGKIVHQSDFIFTKPLKFLDQDDFLNGAVLLRTKMYFEDLKRHLKQVESKLGRIRTKNKNGPRTIDLDVVAFNGVIVDDDAHEFDYLNSFLKKLELL